MAATTLPEGFHSVTPYLTIKGAAEAIEFYKRAFGATEMFRMPMPDGSLAHGEIMIMGSRIMLSDGCSEGPAKPPRELGGTTCGLYVYVDDVDALFEQATAAGAKVVQPPTDQFYGDRSGTLEDPFGHLWFLATHKEDVSAEEVERRAKELFG